MWIQFIVTFLAGLVSVFAYAPFNLILVICISVLWLIFINDYVTNKYNCNKKQIFFIGYIYGLGFFGSQLYWAFYSLYKVIDAGFIISLIAFVLFIGFLSIYFGLVGLVFKQFKTNSKFFNLLFLFPAIFVLAEWVRGWLFTGFPWCDVSYTQVNIPIFRGIYPLIGSYGVSFLLVSILGGVLILLKPVFTIIKNINNKQTVSKNSRICLIYFMVIVLLCSYFQDKTYTKKYGKSISLALIQGNILEGAKWNTDKFLSVYQNLIARAQADVIIIPETAISNFAKYLPQGYLNNLVELARMKGSELVVGMPIIIDKNNNYVNAAIVMTNPKFSYYAKYHLVPFGEYIPFKDIFAKVYKLISLPMVGYSAGSKNQAPLVIDKQKFAFNICYENGFNSELIESVKNATIMANLSDMVWYGGSIAKDEHLQISQARALENQRYFIQDTNTGLTAVINPKGEIQSQFDSFKEGILTDRVYGMVGNTPFEVLGNYPIIIWCFILLLCGLFTKIKIKGRTN